jgi:hypothetical protein
MNPQIRNPKIREEKKFGANSVLLKQGKYDRFNN